MRARRTRALNDSTSARTSDSAVIRSRRAAISASSLRSSSAGGSTLICSRSTSLLTHQSGSWSVPSPSSGLPAPGRSSKSPRSNAIRSCCSTHWRLVLDPGGRRGLSRPVVAGALVLALVPGRSWPSPCWSCSGHVVTSEATSVGRGRSCSEGLVDGPTPVAALDRWAGCRTERIDKWVRGRLGDTLVVETRDPLLVWPGAFPPVYGFALTEVAAGVLRPASGSSYAGGWFFGPHLPVAQWYDVVVDDAVVECGAWTLEDLPDRVMLTWEPGVLAWTEEDEPVVRPPARPAQAGRDPAQLAARRGAGRRRGAWRPATGRCCCWRPDLPTRYYLPREDVRLGLLAATDNVSACPYKGTADGYWTLPGPPELANVAWSYSSPLPAVAAIADRVAFYNELVDLRVDGVLLERPESPFSRAEQRPGGE